MNRKVFWAGFGASLLCLLVWLGYGLSPAWRLTVLDMFGVPPVYVNLPTSLKVTGLIFSALNLPVTLLAGWFVQLEALRPWTAAARGLLMAVSCLLLSALWWWLLARVLRRRK